MDAEQTWHGWIGEGSDSPFFRQEGENLGMAAPTVSAESTRRAISHRYTESPRQVTGFPLKAWLKCWKHHHCPPHTFDFPEEEEEEEESKAYIDLECWWRKPEREREKERECIYIYIYIYGYMEICMCMHAESCLSKIIGLRKRFREGQQLSQTPSSLWKRSLISVIDGGWSPSRSSVGVLESNGSDYFRLGREDIGLLKILRNGPEEWNKKQF